jgi:hypothetical protein
LPIWMMSQATDRRQDKRSIRKNGGVLDAAVRAFTSYQKLSRLTSGLVPALKLSPLSETFEHRFLPVSTSIKAIQGHHLGPCINEVKHKHLSSVLRCIGFCDSPQLGIRPENKVNGGGCPFELARPAITTLV